MSKLFSVLVLVFCCSRLFGQEDPGQALRLSVTYVAPPPSSIEDITDRSVVIVDAFVESIFPSYETSARTLQTDSLLKVNRVLKGTTGVDRIVITQYGGTVPGRTEKFPQIPQLEPGQHYIFFLSNSYSLRDESLPKRNYPRFDVYQDGIGMIRLEEGRVRVSSTAPASYSSQLQGLSFEEIAGMIGRRVSETKAR